MTRKKRGRGLGAAAQQLIGAVVQPERQPVLEMRAAETAAEDATSLESAAPQTPRPLSVSEVELKRLAAHAARSPNLQSRQRGRTPLTYGAARERLLRRCTRRRSAEVDLAAPAGSDGQPGGPQPSDPLGDGTSEQQGGYGDSEVVIWRQRFIQIAKDDVLDYLKSSDVEAARADVVKAILEERKREEEFRNRVKEVIVALVKPPRAAASSTLGADAAKSCSVSPNAPKYPKLTRRRFAPAA